jgi:hypothetical protein
MLECHDERKRGCEMGGIGEFGRACEGELEQAEKSGSYWGALSDLDFLFYFILNLVYIPLRTGVQMRSHVLQIHDVKGD